MIYPRLTIGDLERRARLLTLCGAVLCFALVSATQAEARTTARAVLLAWLYWIGLAAGSMVLLAAHALSGGRWGESARPVLRPSARALLVLAVPFVVVVLAMRLIYPWALDPGVPPASDVARLYLNPYAFSMRGSAILAVWAALGFAAARRERLTPLWAGIGLGLYLLTITVAAIDWSASLVPQWSSSAYGMLIGVSQVTAALAFAALMRSGETSDSATPDIAQLLLAAVLGMAYLGFMQFLVVWSSGLPDKTVWYELRQHAAALALIAAAALIGVAVPFFILLRGRARADAAQTGLAGLLVLIGLALFWAWQVVPDGPVRAIWIYPLAFFGVGMAWLGIAFGPLAHERRPQSEPGHG